MVSVEFRDWQSGFQKVAFNRLLRERTGMSLSDAKQIVDQLLTENRANVSVVSIDVANSLCQESLELGVGGVTIGESAQIESSHTGSH